MMKAAQLAELPEWLKLARGNMILERLIMRSCAALWETIDFFNFPTSSVVNASLKGCALASLLIIINARNTTKSLALRERKSIKGVALFPLQSSSILERASLCQGERHFAWGEE